MNTENDYVSNFSMYSAFEIQNVDLRPEAIEVADTNNFHQCDQEKWNIARKAIKKSKNVWSGSMCKA